MKCETCGCEMSFLGVCSNCIRNNLKDKPVNWDGYHMTIDENSENSNSEKQKEKKKDEQKS